MAQIELLEQQSFEAKECFKEHCEKNVSGKKVLKKLHYGRVQIKVGIHMTGTLTNPMNGGLKLWQEKLL